MREITVGYKQIVDYMKEAGFYGLFVKRAVQHFQGRSDSKTLESRKALLESLLGAFGTNTVEYTFSWRDTPEGFAFWNEQNGWLNDAFFEVPLKYKKVIRHD